MMEKEGWLLKPHTNTDHTFWFIFLHFADMKFMIRKDFLINKKVLALMTNINSFVVN